MNRKYCFCLSKRPFPASLSIFSSFQYTVDSKQMFNIKIDFCRWLDLNRGPLHIGSDCYINWAITTARIENILMCHQFASKFNQPNIWFRIGQKVATAICQIFGLLLGHPRPLVRLFSSFKQISLFYKNNVKNVHPVYRAGIWTHTLQNMSLLP